jgi:hypothetical protein
LARMKCPPFNQSIVTRGRGYCSSITVPTERDGGRRRRNGIDRFCR